MEKNKTEKPDRRSSLREGYNLREQHLWYRKRHVQRPRGRSSLGTHVCGWQVGHSGWRQVSKRKE